MREILFRGKRADNGEWICGHYYTQVFHPDTIEEDWYHYIKPIGSKSWGEVKVIPETVGQYTGLTDKNGTKIFEGDIVKYGNTVNQVVFEQRNGTAYFGVKMDDKETWHFCYLTNAEGMEIIGNIHDNPELLEVSENA